MKTFVRGSDFSFGGIPEKGNRKGIQWDKIQVSVGATPDKITVNEENFTFDRIDGINNDVRHLTIYKDKIEFYYTEDYRKEGHSEVMILDSVVFHMDSGNWIQLIWDNYEDFETFTMLLDEVSE